jgi:hypothetical protein
MAAKPKGSAKPPNPLRKGWKLGVAGMLAPGTGYNPGDIVEILTGQPFTTAQFGVQTTTTPNGPVDTFLTIRNGFYKADPGALCATSRVTGTGIGWELNCVWLPVGAVKAGVVKLVTHGDGYAVGDQASFTTDTFGPPLVIQVTVIRHNPGSPFDKGEIREYAIVDAGAQTKKPPDFCPQVLTTGTGSGASLNVKWVPAENE